MEPHEQWRVDQAEADEREYQRKAGLVFVVIGWLLVAFAVLFLVLLGAGRMET